MPEPAVAARTTALYLLFAHKPYYPGPGTREINTTLVTADTLLHPQVLQPDGARIHDLLTRGRQPGEIIPLATLTHELNGGADWAIVGQACAEPGLSLSGAWTSSCCYRRECVWSGGRWPTVLISRRQSEPTALRPDGVGGPAAEPSPATTSTAFGGHELDGNDGPPIVTGFVWDLFQRYEILLASSVTD